MGLVSKETMPVFWSITAPARSRGEVGDGDGAGADEESLGELLGEGAVHVAPPGPPVTGWERDLLDLLVEELGGRWRCQRDPSRR